MTLAGDIGATKTRLGFFMGRSTSAIATATYVTADFERPSDLIEAFVSKVRRIPVRVVLNADAALIGAALYARDAVALRLRAA